MWDLESSGSPTPAHLQDSKPPGCHPPWAEPPQLSGLPVHSSGTKTRWGAQGREAPRVPVRTERVRTRGGKVGVTFFLRHFRHV